MAGKQTTKKQTTKKQGPKKGLPVDPVIVTKIAPVKKINGIRLDNILRAEKVQGLYKKV